ncbi:MAG: LysR family transcriptional regulator [Planctomycetota bacterium]
MHQRRYYKELRVQQFRALIEIGNHGSGSSAAKTLGISRAAVGQQLQALEDEFGVELTVVNGHRTELTADGRLLLEFAGPVVDGFDGMKAAFLDRKGQLKRRLRVATTASLLHHELRKPVALFRKKHPEVSISLLERPSAEAKDFLQRGHADVAIIGRFDQRKETAQLTFEPLTRYPFMLACPKKHPLARGKPANLNDVIRYPVLFPSQGTNARERIDSVLMNAKLNDRIDLAFDSQNASLLLSYAADGMGVALSSMSPELIKHFGAQLFFQDMSGRFGTEEVVLVQRLRRYELSHVAAFIAIVRDEVNR